MRVSAAAPATGRTIRFVLAVAVLLAAPALAVRADEDGTPVKPSSKKLVPTGYVGRAESAADESSIYQNDHDPAPTSYFFLFGTSGTRKSDWGEHVTLVPNAPAPLGITSIEFSMANTATSTFVPRLKIWDAYNTGASPVNSGLLRQEDVDYGTVSLPGASGFYRGILFPLATPLSLADPDVFIELIYAATLGGPPSPIFRNVVDASPTGPQIGTSENDIYADQNGDGVFTFSFVNGGDRRVFSNTTVCGPSDCQTNFAWHVRGLRNPNSPDPGMDLFETPAGGATFDDQDLPAAFFDSDDAHVPCVPGFSSLAYTASIPLEGTPVVTSPAGILGSTDTIVRRVNAAPLPSPGSSATVPIEMLALSLTSSQPIVVRYSNGSTTINTQWRMDVCLSGNAQPQGSMTITRGPCDGEGGTFTSSLPVLPKLIFTPISGTSCGPVTLDFGEEGLPPIVFGTASGHWVPATPFALDLVEQPDEQVHVAVDRDCDGAFEAGFLPATTNFHAGVRFPRCQADDCLDLRDPEKRLTDEQAQLAAHGVLPAEAHATQAACGGAEDLDQDCIHDPGDNCGASGTSLVANSDQADADDDGVGDACDDCPTVCNPDQADSNGNGVGDVCECAPMGEVPPTPGLQGQPDDRTFVWPAAAGATRYDVVRGTSAGLANHVGPGGADEVCFDDLATTSVVDATNPASATFFFYVVRGENACSIGPYGNEHQNPGPAFNGPARVTTTCAP